MLKYDNYFIPKTLKEYAKTCNSIGNYRIVAGCTDTMPWAREGRAGDVYFKNIIDVSKIKELNYMKIAKKNIGLGAATSFQEIFLDKKIRKNLKILPQISVWFADDQIREQATLGGNIVNASPAADSTPALLSLNAKVIIGVIKGDKIKKKILTLKEFVRGRNKVALGKKDLVIGFDMDNLNNYQACFEKVGHRRSLVISTVCVACVLKVKNNKFEDIRISVSGVCEIPQRLLKVEKFLIGKQVSHKNIFEASLIELNVINSRTRKDYRKQVLQNFIVRSILKSLEKNTSKNLNLNFIKDNLEKEYLHVRN